MASGIRMSGMVSGIDTESIVQAMVATHVAKKEKLQQAQTKLEWKQDAYKAINTKVYALYSKISNLRFSSAYTMKKTTVSDPTKASVTASGTASNGTQSLKIDTLATSGYLTGAQLKEGIKSDSTLADLGYTDGDTSITVSVGSQKKDININGSTKISELIDQLKKAGVKASYDEGNRRIFVHAAETGKANDFSLTGENLSGLKALAALGLSVDSSANSTTYKTMATYAKDTKEETSDDIFQILKSLKGAYDDNANMKIREKDLNDKIAYSDAKDAVDAFNQDDDSAQLIKLLKANVSKYSVVDKDGNVVEDYENKLPYPKVEDEIKRLAKEKGLITETEKDGETKENTAELDKLREQVKKVASIDDNGVLTEEDKAQAYLTSAERDDAKAEIESFAARREANNAVISNKNNAYWDVKDYAEMTDDDLKAMADKFADQVMTAKNIVDGVEGYEIPISEGATRINAEDAKIYLNNAEFTSSSNVFNINGLTITAKAKTVGDEAITINTDTDTQGLYDKIKDFLSEYNAVINELTSLYNAESSKGYEPLTEDQKKEMSDSEIEKWETKIKDSILRRDSTIDGVINAMSSSMMKSYTVNGKTYSLAGFGIHTLGYLNAAKNENYAYHIDGDSEDAVTSGNADKLMDMITNNPEDFQEFMKQLTTGLYQELDKKMKGTKLSSAYTIYNDKQMTKDYDSYKKQIKAWEAKIESMETRYYRQYANMEKQLSKMQSATSSLSGLLGGSQ